jgi:hypothetical protein
MIKDCELFRKTDSQFQENKQTNKKTPADWVSSFYPGSTDASSLQSISGSTVSVLNMPKHAHRQTQLMSYL